MTNNKFAHFSYVGVFIVAIATVLLILFSKPENPSKIIKSAEDCASNSSCTYDVERNAIDDITVSFGSDISGWGASNPDTDHCAWYNIECDESKSIIKIHLSYRRFRGTLPTTLGNLQKLTRLELANNILTGSLPTELGKISDLRFLSFDNNRLAGSLPTQLGHLNKLVSLIMNDNLLTGSIPTELGNIYNLKNLTLENNRLVGSVPTELGLLTDLGGLRLANNRFTGLIPSEIGKLPLLKEVTLAKNNFRIVPAEICDLKKRKGTDGDIGEIGC